MTVLEEHIVEKIASGGDTFVVLSTLVSADRFREVDKALQRLRRKGVIAWNKPFRPLWDGLLTDGDADVRTFVAFVLTEVPP